MATKQEILGWFESNDIEEKRIAIVEFFTNEENPFDDRWEVYSRTPEVLMTHSQWICHEFESSEFAKKYYGGEISWYDDFYIERHEIVELPQLIHRLNVIEPKEANDEMLKCFKRCAMSTGLHYFEYDW